MLPEVDKLPIMEAFYTVQGEGEHTGKAAYFIRTGGCDVGCVWCDVKDSWDADKHPSLSISEIVNQANAYNCQVVVVTGGEPLMYNLTSLTQAIHQSGKRTHIETAGVYPITGDWDWICFSPKKFKEPIAEYFEKSHELKVIVYNKSDFAWAETHAQKMNSGASLFLQPEWDKRDQMMPLIVEYVKQNPKWRISLQTHKYLNIP